MKFNFQMTWIIMTLLVICTVLAVFRSMVLHTSKTSPKNVRNVEKSSSHVKHFPSFKEVIEHRSTDYLMVSDPDASGAINVKSPGSNLVDAAGNGVEDDTSALQAIFNYADTQTNPEIYFPPGEYVITSNIVVKGSVRVFGSERGMSVIKTNTSNVTPIFGNIDGTLQSGVLIEFLFFDGIQVAFGKKSSAKRNISVSHCVFFNTTLTPSNMSFVRLRHVSNSVALSHSVFLGKLSAFGPPACTVYKGRDIRIENNIFGLDLSQIDWLDTQLTDSYWSALKPKLRFLQVRYSLANDQGCFRCAITVSLSNNSVIEDNIFNGSPNFVPTSQNHHDHVVYLKGFVGMKFIRNYARGWPNDGHGGIKTRNGIDLVIARNYIDDTGILMYTHLRPLGKLYPGLKDVLVYGNKFVERTFPQKAHHGIFYHEPHHGGRDENLVYSANTFEITGHGAPFSRVAINPGNGNISEHKIFCDNVYHGSNVTVTLRGRWSTPTCDNGTVNATQVAPYRDMTVPSYDIPTYETP